MNIAVAFLLVVTAALSSASPVAPASKDVQFYTKRDFNLGKLIGTITETVRDLEESISKEKGLGGIGEIIAGLLKTAKDTLEKSKNFLLNESGLLNGKNDHEKTDFKNKVDIVSTYLQDIRSIVKILKGRITSFEKNPLEAIGEITKFLLEGQYKVLKGVIEGGDKLVGGAKVVEKRSQPEVGKDSGNTENKSTDTRITDAVKDLDGFLSLINKAYKAVIKFSKFLHEQ